MYSLKSLTKLKKLKLIIDSFNLEYIEIVKILTQIKSLSLIIKDQISSDQISRLKKLNNLKSIKFLQEISLITSNHIFKEIESLKRLRAHNGYLNQISEIRKSKKNIESIFH
jgi:hypothetical protein